MRENDHGKSTDSSAYTGRHGLGATGGVSEAHQRGQAATATGSTRTSIIQVFMTYSIKEL